MRLAAALLLTTVASVSFGADLRIELVRASGQPIPAVVEIEYRVEQFNQDGDLLDERTGTAPFSSGLASVPLIGDQKTPVRATVIVPGYSPVAIEPLNPSKAHDVKMIVGREATRTFVAVETREAQRRVLGSPSLRMHLTDALATAYDIRRGRLEVLERVLRNNENRYDIYSSDLGGFWAVSKTIYVKCVVVRGKRCWVTLGVPVWRSAGRGEKWRFRGYLQERYSGIQTIEVQSEQVETRRVYD